MKIVGKRIVDYVSKKTQQPVKGISLQCITPRNDTEGLAVEQIYISEKSAMYADLKKAPLDTEINVFYNRYGSVETVTIVK